MAVIPGSARHRTLWGHGRGRPGIGIVTQGPRDPYFTKSISQNFGMGH